MGTRKKSINANESTTLNHGGGLLQCVLKVFWDRAVSLALFGFSNRPLSLWPRFSSPKEGQSRTLWVDVSRAAASERTTGIERLTREVSRHLEREASHYNLEVKFFRVDWFGRLWEVSDQWLSQTRRPWAETTNRALVKAQDAVLLLDLSLPPKGLNSREIIKLQAKCSGVFAVVYDVLPLTHPELFPTRKMSIFRVWFDSVSGVEGHFYISRATAEKAQRVASAQGLKLAPRRVTIPIGIDHMETEAPAQPKLDGYKKAAFSLVAVGTLEPRKSYPLLLDVVEQLWKEGIRVSLTIVGRKGWKSDDLIKRIISHPKYGNLLFWEDNLDDSGLINLFRVSDLFVALSIDEGFGLPLLEAQYLGLPVVARDISVFREVAPASYFVDCDNPREVSGLLSQLIETGIGRTSQILLGPTWKDTAGTILTEMFGSRRHDEISFGK